jgi:hypothetical protein
MSHIFQISLKSIFLLENGEKIYPKGKTMLTTSLVYPREGVKILEAVKILPLSLEEGEKRRPLKLKEEYSFELEPFEDKLLFKESIQAESIIRVDLAVCKSVSKLNEFLLSLVKAGILAATGNIKGALGTVVTVAMSQTAVESFFDKAKEEEKIFPLATASFGITSDFKGGEMIFNLVTKKDIEYVVERKENEEGQIVEIRRTIPKGNGIGKVVLNVERKPKDAITPVA